MESQILLPLNSLETHLNQLVTSLTQTNTFTSAPQLAKDLLADDDNLTTSLTLLQRHQQNYARTLNLRAEVTTLQEQLKDTVRRCVSLRTEIGQIHPSILGEDTDSDDENEDEDSDIKVSEVNYHTLLTFAARIGKHNALAAREAEAESTRRKVAAAQAKNASQATSTSTAANGIVDPTQSTTTNTEAAIDNATAETSAELSRIDNSIALSRAQMGMAFSDANILRVGALGQMQLFQERQTRLGGGEDDVAKAVEREADRLVRESEGLVNEEEEEGQEESRMDLSPQLTRASTAGVEGRASQSTQKPSGARPPGAAAQAKPKRKLNLDFPSSDEEGDG